MSFQQSPPNLGNQYEDDRVLRSYLARVLPESMRNEIEPSLIELGRLAGGELYQMQLADRLNEPKLTQWDAWGNRIDTVEVTALWREAERLAVEFGLVATAYEQKHGSLSRVHQCALAYLFTPSTDIYSCPLAMTDGAAKTLLSSGNQELIDRAVPHLISRNPEEFWTAGQWMTELTGGSDVGLSQTIASRTGSAAVASESQFPWRLAGNKWFASAITSQIALTLARPEGNPDGGRGLALFYVELRDETGRLRNIQINRLKDKLGTRKVPTAELTLVGTPAQLVKGATDGVRNIAPLLNITRLWNGISAVALMRRGLALATDYARQRTAFGARLSEKPLHMDTLAGLQAEFEGAFHLAFLVAELTGRAEVRSPKPSRMGAVNSMECAGPAALWPEAQQNSPEADIDEVRLLRLLTPIMKLTTAKQAVAVASEVIEAFGGAGYVEDTGLPQLLRDAQVLPIWEGTTNVLSLDTLRALDLGAPAPSCSASAERESIAVGSSGDRTVVAQVGMSQGEEGGLAPAQVKTGSTPDNKISPTTGTASVSPAASLPLEAFRTAILTYLSAAHEPQLADAIAITQAAMVHAETWLSQTQGNQSALEAGARRFATTLGRTMELALLIRHAQWSLDHEADSRSVAAARRFASSGIDLIADHDLEDVQSYTSS